MRDVAGQTSGKAAAAELNGQVAGWATGKPANGDGGQGEGRGGADLGFERIGTRWRARGLGRSVRVPEGARVTPHERVDVRERSEITFPLTRRITSASPTRRRAPWSAATGWRAASWSRSRVSS